MMTTSIRKTSLVLGIMFFGVAPLRAADPPLNSLTPEEKEAGWELLFDGHSLAGWRAYGAPGGSNNIGSGWRVETGLLAKAAGEKGGDIITERTFNDFELTWEWRIPKGGNNGVKYMVTEARPAAPGHEYQMIDDLNTTLDPKHRTASFYDVLPPASDPPLRPAGEWNLSKITVKGDHVEHWLNGKLVLEFELGSPAVREGLKASKFRSFPDFGTKIRGHIMLTDHRDGAWFRNVKVRDIR